MQLHVQLKYHADTLRLCSSGESERNYESVDQKNTGEATRQNEPECAECKVKPTAYSTLYFTLSVEHHKVAHALAAALATAPLLCRRYIGANFGAAHPHARSAQRQLA